MISLGQVVAGTGLAAGAAGPWWVAALPQPAPKAPPAAAARGVEDGLVILASAPDPLALTAQVRQRRLAGLAGLLTVRSDDCTGLGPGLYVAALPAAADGRALAAARQKAADAYVRRCTFPTLVHARRKRSSGGAAGGGRDPAGRGQGRPGRVRDCTRPEVSAGARHIAVACAEELVLEQPIYRTRIFRADTLQPVASVGRRRRPSFPHPGRAQCLKQDVASDGSIAEAPRPIPLP